MFVDGAKEFRHDVLFPLEGEIVHRENLSRQEQACDFARVQSNSQEAQCAAPIHGGASDVEGESGHGGIHQDAKVVAEVGSGDAQSPHTRQYESVSSNEQDVRDVGLVDWLEKGLVLQGFVIQVIPEDTQREDGEGQEVAAIVGVPEYLC